MNILPKKRWHVRTKDNIARVRRDEAEARGEQRKRDEKLAYAESEVRLNFLRKQTGLPERQTIEKRVTAASTHTTESSNSGQHLDLFADFKSHIRTTNKELEKEKKEEQEKYEKQIGYLTYLGQDTNEALKLHSWYEVAPKRAKVQDNNDIVEKNLKSKLAQDPLTLINELLPPEENVEAAIRKRKCSDNICADVLKITSISEATIKKLHNIKKHKKEKTHKHEKFQKNEKRSKKSKKKVKEYELNNADKQLKKKELLAKLRKERLHREATERARQEALLVPKDTAVHQPKKDPYSAPTPRVVQKYNSQFNPELAKQNML